MTLEEIDEALADWHAKLSVSSQNLIAIDDLFTFRRLNGEGGLSAPVLTGASAERVPAAVASITKLWEYQQMLSAMVDKADKLRKSMPTLFGSEKVRAQITDILQGTSIDFPPIETPLAERSLLTATAVNSALSPQRLLEIMARTFELSKATIMEVDAAWSRLEPQLASLNQEADRLQAAAADVGETAIPEMDTIRRRIGELSNAMNSDPLGAGATAQDELLPLIDTVRKRVDAAAAVKSKALSDLDQATRMLRDLQNMQTRTAKVMDELQSRVDIQAFPLKTLDASVLVELSNWLDTLTASCGSGNWRALQVGLSRWLSSASAAMNTVKSALDAASSAMEASAELKGRLLVQRSRAESAMRKGIRVPDTVSRIADEAEALLRQKPLPLDRARQLVEAYERSLGEVLK